MKDGARRPFWTSLQDPTAGRAKILLIEVAAAVLMTCLATGARILLDVTVPGVAPYLFIFPAITGAVLLAGPRSGLMTLVSCQMLAWYAVVPVRYSFELASRGDAAGLFLSTVSEGILLWALATYRAAIRDVAKVQADRSDMLRLALRELDHRTKNNLQIIQSLLYLKAQRSKDPETARELGAAGVRIGLIASVNSNLAQNSKDISNVALQSYLSAVCEQLDEALCPDNVELAYDFEEAEIDSQRALYLGLIVNELVTNAVKHAFPAGEGRIEVALRHENGMLVLSVADTGCGKGNCPTGSRPGLGSRLIQMMVSRIGATMQELPGPGTGYRFEIQAAAG